MTRAICSKTSKRKHTKPIQEFITEDCKENSPCTKETNKKTNFKKTEKLCSNAATLKNNGVLGNHFQNSVAPCINDRGLRKSERQRKSSFNKKDFVYNLPKEDVKTDASAKRSVLSDTTNSPVTRGTKTNTQTESFQNVLNKRNNSIETVKPSQPNKICIDKGSNKLHIPVYNTIDPTDRPNATRNLLIEKKETVYEFDEVDENEEPTKKRKKKKKANVRKPRIGPKALTINNIKYSSTESLVSLPEKPVRQRKSKTKMSAPSVKPLTLRSNLNNHVDTHCSIQSFVSDSHSLLLCDNRNLKNRHELSVLQETQSENCHSPFHEASETVNNVKNQTEITVNCHQNSNSAMLSAVLPNDCSVSRNISTVSQQRCYASKKSLPEFITNGVSHCGSTNDSLVNQGNHCSSNTSMDSPHDFLSSTPCKRTSLVVCHNSVFSDTYDRDIPDRLRPSTGFIKNISANSLAIDDNCFGFDEPEELEEPLVSPIKNINLQEPKIRHWHHHELSLHNNAENPKPDIKEVIERLKSSIPKAQPKESTEVFNSDSSTSHSNTTSPISKEVETASSFLKPPRRSYERPRRIRHYSEHEEDNDEEEEDEENDSAKDNGGSQNKLKKHEKPERETVSKPANKCYKKINLSKVLKAPHVPKAKQRMLKEEEELERLAAQMNAQFQEIEKCSLVVE